MSKRAACLRPTCERPERSRGLCHSCYSAANTLVRRGKTTWAELEARGKANPMTKRGPKSVTIAWLLAAK